MRLAAFLSLMFAASLAQAQASSYSTSDWTLCVGDCSTTRLLELKPIEPIAPAWNFATYGHGNPDGSRLNQVFYMGWNMAATGGPFVSGEPALGYAFESNYAPYPGARWMEHHLVFITSAGYQKRPQTWVFDRTTNAVRGGIYADRFSFGQEAGYPPTLDVFSNADGSGGLSLGTGIAGQRYYFIARWNGYPLVYTLNGAGTGFIPLLTVDASDRVNVTPAGNTASFGGPVQLGDGPTWRSGTGAPSGACTSGSLYSRTDGPPGLYVCDCNSWVAK